MTSGSSSIFTSAASPSPAASLCRVPCSRALARELLLGRPQRSTSPLMRAQMLRQLIAARISVERILGGVDLARLLQDLPRELLIVEV